MKGCVQYNFVLMLYIKFQVPSSSGSLVLQPTKGETDRQTDGQTDRLKPICPLNFFEVGGRSWGHKNCLVSRKSDVTSRKSCGYNFWDGRTHG